MEFNNQFIFLEKRYILYSEKYGILIIGIPKTGILAIQDVMLNLDSKGLTHGITINGR
jgi:hypothetical protein